jgi:hypothetical protein
MKTAAHRPSPQRKHQLAGLSAKYARKLEKPLANTLYKLSRKFSKLLHKKQEGTHKATRETARFLVKRLYKAFGRRGAGLALRPA